MPRLKTKNEVLKNFHTIHGNRYDYSDIDYINAKSKINIKCRIHGVFNQTPDAHLRGKGCPMCGYIDRANSTRKCERHVIKEFKKVHGDRYNYSNVKYTGAKDKIHIECRIHGAFFQTPDNHKQGKGCPKCNLGHGWSEESFIDVSKSNGVDNDCILYIIKCFDDNEKFYKIGITSRSIKKRFDSNHLMPYSYIVITEVCGSAKNIFNLEKKMHSQYRDAGLSYTPMKLFPGHTECFTNLIDEVL